MDLDKAYSVVALVQKGDIFLMGVLRMLINHIHTTLTVPGEPPDWWLSPPSQECLPLLNIHCCLEQVALLEIDLVIVLQSQYTDSTSVYGWLFHCCLVIWFLRQAVNITIWFQNAIPRKASPTQLWLCKNKTNKNSKDFQYSQICKC